jgi:diacylglycerol kinase family enzyme
VFAEGATRRGLRAYVHVVAREIFGYRSQSYRLRFPDRLIERRAFVIAIANGPQWGNGAIIAPRAALDDGLLDVVVVEARSAARIAWHVPRLFNGRIDRVPGVSVVRSMWVEIESTEPLCMQADGEALSGKPLVARAEVHRGALLVCA